jgi:hypothetical protein
MQGQPNRELRDRQLGHFSVIKEHIGKTNTDYGCQQ